MAAFGIFHLRFASKPYVLEVFENWPFFDPKLRTVTSLKRHFIKKSLVTDFADILCEDPKLTLNKYVSFASKSALAFTLLGKFVEGGGGVIRPPVNGELIMDALQPV